MMERRGSQLEIFYREGQAAKERGLPRSACPYAHTGARMAWNRGWQAGPADERDVIPKDLTQTYYDKKIMHLRARLAKATTEYGRINIMKKISRIEKEKTSAMR